MRSSSPQVSLALPLRARRLLLVALVLATVAWCSRQAWLLLSVNGRSPLELVAFGCLTLLVVPLALHFWVSVAGFVMLRRAPLRAPRDTAAQAADGGAPRTALVMPIYNEDPRRVFAGVEAILDSLAQTGRDDEFAFHVLSDTNDPELWLEEEARFARLRAKLPHPERFHYRNRARNTERKAGNVLEFCRSWGDRYRYMIVLDADSLLDGTSVLALVERMEADPRAGIVQAPTVIVNRKTLFGRMLQFSASVYGRIAMHGLNFWLADQGNYWGHNAIIRIAPFLEHCRLPVLSGKEPLGGSILSHDFVEAALMLRAGWRVRLAPEIDGSYEESPPSLIDYAARDRRWCQGNLQHLRLVLRPGLNVASRIQLALGAAAYLAAPLWLFFLVVGTTEALRQGLTPHEYFPQDAALFPVWREEHGPRSAALLATIALLLFLPKLLGLVSLLRDPERARRVGGRAALLRSAGFEALFSLLLAPVLAVLQTIFVVTILSGNKVGWNAQRRSDAGTTWSEGLRRHSGTTLLGVVWTAAVAHWIPSFLPWLAPVLAGFLLAIPFSVWSSRVALGLAARRRGLFVTPEELEPPRIVSRYRALLARATTPRPASAPTRDAIERILAEPGLRRVHLELLDEPEPGPDPLELHALDGLRLKRSLRGPEALSAAERRALLSHAASVLRLVDEASVPTAPLGARS